MGWFGWTEQQTLDTTIPAIELAYEGALDRMQKEAQLRTMNFAPAPEPTPAPEPASSEKILSAFRMVAGPSRNG
jgi:hypothetical protein